MLKRLQLVWSDENEKWYYYLGLQEKTYEELMEMLPDGYVDYYLLLDNGIIMKDTFGEENVGTELSFGVKCNITIQCFCSITEHSYSSLLDSEKVYLKDNLTDKVTEYRDINTLAEFCDGELTYMNCDTKSELSPENKLILEEYLDFK